MDGDFEFRVFESLTELGREQWEPLFGDAAHGYDYYRACELAPPEAFQFFAVGLFEQGRLVAGSPMFRVVFRLDMLMDNEFERLGKWLQKNVPWYANVPVVGAGSPHADELSLVISPTLDVKRRGVALQTLLRGIHQHAAKSGARIVFVKSVSDSADHWAGAHFRKLGYSRIASLPLARLVLPEAPEDYVSSLSANMRSNFRRKLKRAKNIKVDIRDSIDGLDREINELRSLTRARSKADYDVFEDISPDYFRRVTEHVCGRAKLLTYWKDDLLVGFALALLEENRIIEKYTGLRYPEGIDHGIFFLNWMTLVRLGVESGARELHAGETTYLTKVRLGCQLERSWIYVRHRLNIMNPILKAITPLLAFDKTDPDLKLLGKSAPYIEPGSHPRSDHQRPLYE